MIHTQSAHQNRYEQIGKIVGKLTIDDHVYNIDLHGFRDHGFGHRRDWTLMHRYAYFILFLKNGYSISVGIVCQPCTGTRQYNRIRILLSAKLIVPLIQIEIWLCCES